MTCRRSRQRCLTAKVVVFWLGAGLWATLTAAPPAPQVRSVRLYVLDCGILLRQDPASYNLTTVAAPHGDMSVPCFLVVHPGGTLLWEAGGVPDSRVVPGVATDLDVELVPGRKIPWRVDKTLKGQLTEISYQPADITYLALSHVHYDHTTNANDYAASTWLVQQAERERMFGDKPPSNFASYSALKNSKTVILHGDHDVFGDGTVVIKSTPGHTPGHQSLFVKLTRTGPVFLSGDLYHYPEERVQGVAPTFEFNQEQTLASRAAMEAFMKSTGAQLWIQHDILGNAALKKSPAYYD
jgi:N-acyl homoserine lactone hydrolase